MNEEKRPFYKKWWLWLVIVIAVIWIIFGGEEETDDGEVDTRKQTVEQQLAKQGDMIDNQLTDEEDEPTESEIHSEDDTKRDTVTSDLPAGSEIIGKKVSKVNEVLGEPESREETDFRLSGTETTVPAVQTIYQKGTFEMLYIEGTAQRVTYTPADAIAYDKATINELLNELGLESGIISLNDFVTKAHAEGVHDVSVYNKDGNIHYVYIIVEEKYK